LGQVTTLKQGVKIPRQSGAGVGSVGLYNHAQKQQSLGVMLKIDFIGVDF